MGTSNESVSPLGVDVHYRQTLSPNYETASFTADDTDDHIIQCPSRGKGRLTVAVDNPANQALTVTVYGMHALAGAIGDVGTFPILPSLSIAAASKDYLTCNDPYPFYLIKVTYAVVPTDNPLKTCTAYINFSAV